MPPQPNQRRATHMTGPSTDNNPPMTVSSGVWHFINDTGEPICDFHIRTGPKSFMEIELFGFGSNPPDIRHVRIVRPGKRPTTLHDGPVKDTTLWGANLRDCIAPGEQFEVHIEFDEAFDPDQWIHFDPTDGNGTAIVSEFTPGEAHAAKSDAVGALIGAGANAAMSSVLPGSKELEARTGKATKLKKIETTKRRRERK